MIAALLALAAPALADGHVAVLLSDDLPAYEAPADLFESSVGLETTRFNLDGDRRMADRVAEELQRDPPAIIFALGAKAAWIAEERFPDVPKIYAMVLDPERYGIDGARTTGVHMVLPAGLALAQFQLLLPDVNEIAILASPSLAEARLGEAVTAAEAAGYRVTVARVSDGSELRRAFAQLSRRVDALWLMPDPELLTPANFRYVRDASVRARVPLLASSETLVRAGALLGVTPDHQDVGEAAARLARQILAAEPGAPMPAPVYPDAVRVVLNRATLEALGRKLDPVLYDFVDEVVEPTSAR